MEILNPNIPRGHIRHAMFDFDGTVSLLREGWRDIMTSMMVEFLMETPRHESRTDLERVVVEFIDNLTGKPTIYQMLQLCDEIRARGGQPADASEYKRVYVSRLGDRMQHRMQALNAGRLNPEELMVPGIVDMLKDLRARGVMCHLASGTDEVYVLREAEALGIAPYFASIHGARADYVQSSKKALIEGIMRDYRLNGNEFVAFGDGVVEIEDTKAVGGIAVGVASNEATRLGIDLGKRASLIRAGADMIIPDFCEHTTLVEYLFPRQ